MLATTLIAASLVTNLKLLTGDTFQIGPGFRGLGHFNNSFLMEKYDLEKVEYLTNVK